MSVSASTFKLSTRPEGVIIAVLLAIVVGLLVRPATAQKPRTPVNEVSLATPPPSTISISLNKARLVNLQRPVRDVVVSNPEIADVIVKTPTTAYLVAKSVGETNVFFVGADGKVVLHNAVRVNTNIAAARQALKDLLPGVQIDVEAVGNSIVLKGNVSSAEDSAGSVAVARQFVEDDANVINMLKILADQQVLLQVRVAEVQRNVVKNLAAATSFSSRILRRPLTAVTGGGNAFTSPAIAGTLSLNFLGFGQTGFTALERQGMVKTLAEPALTAISGESASFLAGGEFPVPSGIDSNGNLIVEFREFGVALSFTPVVLGDGRISLRIETEVSRQAAENTLVLPFGTNNQTVNVIGLSVRRASSTINLPSGGNLMIAGLIQNDEFNSVDGAPGLKDIPILGALFRSEQFIRNKTELIVLVRAFLVRSVEPASPLSLPTDGFAPSSDFDLYLLGRLHAKYGGDKSSGEIPLIDGPFGYIMK